MRPHPIPEDLVGHAFEVDKMSAEHNQYTWHYFTKDSPLQPAGLVGPVRLVTQAEQEL